MSHDNEDLETGEPIAELALLLDVPSPGFGARIKRALGRRLFAGEFVNLGLMAPLIVALEFISAIFQALTPGSPNGDRR